MQPVWRVLCGSGGTCGPGLLWHVRQGVGSGGDELVRMKTPFAMFSGRGVNPALPADAAIDLREERRRQRNIRNAAQINGRHKTSEIANESVGVKVYQTATG